MFYMHDFEFKLGKFIEIYGFFIRLKLFRARLPVQYKIERLCDLLPQPNQPLTIPSDYQVINLTIY